MLKVYLVFIYLVIVVNAQNAQTKHSNIILFGSTGDLARKYLWQGFFNLFLKYESENQIFRFYACSRSDVEVGSPKLDSILKNNISCEGRASFCIDKKEKFLKHVSYLQIRTDKHFTELRRLLQLDKSESEVIFYLSIPPEAYISTTKSIYNCCYDKNQIKRYFRIVIEKPFGHDLSSARLLIKQMSTYFKEEEILRVDHYLGKSTVREIIPFRLNNMHLESLWNKNFVERVEIVLKETIDVKGRINYYNQNGVIRDTLQNHLMEIMALIAMDVPSKENNKEISLLKLKLLKEIEKVETSALVLGQYSDYIRQSHQEDPQFSTAENVPTFSAALLTVNSERWSGVPFILMSGKNLDVRTSYARILFKKNRICVSNCTETIVSPQITFHIGYGKISKPMIIATKDFKSSNALSGISPPLGEELDREFSDFFVASSIYDVDAYSAVIEDIYLDVQENFVSSERLEAMWNVWDDVLAASRFIQPQIYNKGDAEKKLDFYIHGKNIEFIQNFHKNEPINSKEAVQHQTPNSFLGHKLVCSEQEKLIDLLSKDIANAVYHRLKSEPFFHIAFSGGETPISLFRHLAWHYTKLPWYKIHVWQVDERCVAIDDQRSNFRQLESYLLKFINIPYSNIHPMPVYFNGGLCNGLDKSENFYEADIKFYIPHGKFDYLILGLGKDGHTASLFPEKETLESTDLVAIVRLEDISRMTLTYKTINAARHVSILVTGKEKRNILKTLESSQSSFNNFPILGIKSHDMKWFIDDDALPT